MCWRCLKIVLVLLCGLLQFRGHAEDIDIFAAAGGSTAAGANVLFVMDNAANFSANVSGLRCSITAAGVVDTSGSGTSPTNLDGTAAAVQQCALYQALNAISASATLSFNVGVMVFNNTNMRSFNAVTNSFVSDQCSGNTGGCLVLPLTPFTSSNKTNILAWIRGWTLTGANDIKSSNNANGAAMQEAWAYFTGATGVSGRSYSSIVPGTTCGGNYIIFVGNAYRNNSTPGDQTNASNSPRLPLIGEASPSSKNASPAATSGERAVINDTITTQCGTASLETAENKGIFALNWARYMKNQHQIRTYSVGVLGPSCNAEYASHLSKLGASDVGGGKYFPTDSFSELQLAFSTILSEILATNTAFAAVSLPVSVNTQGLFLNQVFIGMFRPSQDFLPRWRGNLKQYKMGLANDGVSLELEDSNGATATNPNTGFIASCAISYWNRTAAQGVDSYWANDPRGTCLSISGVTDAQALKGSNYPDGEIVEKGGQAYRLRQLTPSNRNVKTCAALPAACTTALDNFNTSNSNITQAALDPTRTGTKDTLINWARGANVGPENELSLGTSAMRGSVHGDVVHSRPVAVNHGTDASPNIVVYYGANDGMLRAVNGNRSTSATFSGTSYAAGDELWSFMPPEFYGRIRRLYDNELPIRYPGTPATTSAPKDYGMDGPVTAYQSGSTVNIYATMRRGGRMVYAFNVSSPAAPQLLWRQGCPNLTNDNNCTSDVNNRSFGDIGQTWSSVKPITVAGQTAPALIFGGGYDTCEDVDGSGANHNCSGSSKGRKIYILSGSNGAILRAFDTVRPVVADVTVVTDGAGNATYAYAVDMGGDVYRVTFAAGGAANWTITRIASLGCSTRTASTYTSGTGITGVGYSAATAAACSAPRKFMFAPSVVTPDNGTSYLISVGSGDREKPVAAYTVAQSVTNRFFQLKDRPADANWLTAENATCSSTDVICQNSLYAIGASTPTPAQLATKPKGWYFDLSAGEQTVTLALTVFGVTTFSTNKPVASSSTSCSASLGETRLYSISYVDASPALAGATSRSERVVGDGLPPSPVAGKVLLDPPAGSPPGTAGTPTPFCIGCSANSPLASTAPKQLSTVTRPKGRLYWYLEK
jgi:type IV pilus assembly protein PilY1